MNEPLDLAAGPNPHGRGLLLHRADCPTVRAQADAGEPVMTMLGCPGPMPRNIPLHSCLGDATPAPHSAPPSPSTGRGQED